MHAADVVIDDVHVVSLPDSVTGPHQEGDSRHAVVAVAAGTAGVFGPVDELPAALVAASLGRTVIGCRVSDHAWLLARLLARLGPHGAGLGRWAAGAVDCAVWDLHGKLTGLPVAALLTETPAPRVPVYGSWLSLDLGHESAADAVRGTAAQGFAFTKWSMRRTPNVQQMAALAGRAAAWAEAPVALDALGTWNVETAAAMASLLPPGTVRWVEDPLPRTEKDAYRELCAASSLPVAFGERLCDASSARELLELGPAAFTFDVAWCGGITEACTWMALAEQSGTPVHLHGRAFLPALHLAAAFPHVAGPVEYQVVWEPKRQRSLSGTVVPVDGWAALPEGPGMGLEVRC
ncbi:enolase C-terminal domain-like protein [Streptomyces sp. NPDC005859]|uniref:enolase C-terminal domain-like protein n=1 Tax=Streptomyces sp. NPDC005859 TaxID=3157170 RepID=UPI0033C36CD4